MICFISGHTNLTQREFDLWYKPAILNAIDKGATFVVGDAKGCDRMAQNFLGSHSGVTIYHMFDTPRNYLVTNAKTKGGFKTDEERDAAMTLDSTHDILWMRPAEENRKILGKEYNPSFISGTEKNLLRRSHHTQ